MSEPEPTALPAPGIPTETVPWIRQLVAQLQEDQRLRWQRGERIETETYLRQHPDLQTDPDSVLDLIRNEVRLREQCGDRPQLDEYLRRFPELAQPLREQFEVHQPPQAKNQSGVPSTIDSAAAPPATGSEVPVVFPTVPGYEVLRELGRGGMGVVYLARHLRLKRHVALKMIRDGALAGTEQLARFRMEAEVIAHLQHPNIVQIYEVGEQDGRPYIALEYLEGGSLHQKQAGKPLPARQAAELVEPLALAIHYAHTRGIVHRDLKPANILLQTTEHTEDTERRQEKENKETPEKPSAFSPTPPSLSSSVSSVCSVVKYTPKITDFGLAKLLEGDSGLSQPGSLMGTPNYMPPEQALGQTEQIGPAADVYALGAILYELLTGRPPFVAESHWKTLEQVRSQEPVPPSRVQPQVPRDLETICLKCLQKDRHKRYPSAWDLGLDLRRFLAGEPIQARPVGLVERAVKWAKRRPTAAALLLVSALAGVALLVEGLLYNQRVRTERDYAVKNFQRARLAVEQMLTEVAEEQLAFEPRMEEKRRHLLEKALAFYQEFLDESPTDPRVRQETALAYKRVADILRLLGRHDQARAAYGQAIALLAPLAADQPTEFEYQRNLAECHNFLGEVLRALSRPEEAEAAYQQARALQEPLQAELPPRPAYSADLARTYYNLGILYQRTSRWTEAETFLRQALALLHDQVERFPQTPQYRHHLARGHFNLGPVLRKTGRFSDAEASYVEAITLLRQLTADAPDNPDYSYELAVSSNNLGNLLAQRQRDSEARAAHEQARDLFQTLARDFPRVPVYRQEWANTLNSLGTALALEAGRWRAAAHVLCLESQLGASLALVAFHTQQARLAAAQKTYDQARVLLRQLVAEPGRLADYWADLGLTHSNLGWVLSEQEDWAEAQGHFAQAIACLKEALEPNPRNPFYLGALRDQYRNLAETLIRLGDPVAGTEAARVLADGPGAEAQDAYFAACFVVRCAALLEQPALAEAYHDQAMQLLKQAVQKGFQDVAQLQTDPHLQPLRARPSFPELVAQVEAASRSTPRPAPR